MSKKFKISLISSNDAGSFEQAQEDGHYSTPGTHQPDRASLFSGPVTRIPSILMTPSAPHTITTKHGWAFAGKALNLINTLTRGQAGWFHRLLSFLLVGGMGALVNLVCFSGTYYLLSQSGNTSLAFFTAFIIATEVSIVCNFVLNDRFTFRHLHQSHLSWSTRCVRFHITSIGGTALTLGISFSLLHLVHVSAFLAQAIALITATAFNFTFHHIFTYRHGGRRNNHNNTRSAQIADSYRCHPESCVMMGRSQPSR